MAKADRPNVKFNVKQKSHGTHRLKRKPNSKWVKNGWIKPKRSK